MQTKENIPFWVTARAGKWFIFISFLLGTILLVTFSLAVKSQGVTPTIAGMMFIFLVNVALVSALALLGVAVLNWEIRRARGRLQWLTNVVSFHFERLKSHGLLEDPAHDKQGQNPAVEWPWGTHHTEMLGHLRAAAEKYWRLYDPSDITTAPTNDMVSEWLTQERGVSKDKARAIASILRADGLPTGPRR